MGNGHGGTEMASRRKQMMQIAATYIGTVVGAGFATGREIVEFFTSYGSAGLIGIIISGLLFIFLGTRIMLVARKIGAHTYEDINRHMFGSRMASFVNIILFIMLFGVTSVMLSGTGAIFKEQLHLSFQIGIFLTLFLVYIVMQKGMKGILWTNSIVVPIMVLFSIVISISMLDDAGSRALIEQDDFIGQWKWLFSSFTYAAFNLTLATAILVPLSKEAEDDGVIKWGGLFGGLGLMFILLNSHFALYSVPRVLNYEIPIAEIIGQLGAVVHLLFLLVVYGEIFTTLIGNLFGLVGSLTRNFRASSNMLLLVIMLGSYLISQFGYSSLLHFLYPLFGMIGLVFLVMLAFKR